MIAIDQMRVKSLIELFKDDISGHWEKIKERLVILHDAEDNKSQKAYLARLLKKGQQLITATPKEIEELKTEFNNILEIDTSDKSIRGFKNRVIYALGYSERRSDFYPEYFRSLGIKACVYCNSQLCLTVKRNNGALQARFQVDHFVSKDEYPCLSVALFNLYPVCASCNNIKGTKKVPFKLYSETPITCGYNFSIKDVEKTIAKYLTDRNPKHIEIDFDEEAVVDGTLKIDDVFSIKGIYNTQIDIVEELIMKAHVYDKSYRETLLTKYSELFPDENVLHRFIVGNYIEQDEIHNRPLSKFMQDIAKQLKLI